MSTVQFIYIEGLSGESRDENHIGWMDILNFRWGIQNASSPPMSAKASFQDLTFTKRVDRTTPDLALACAEGRRFPSASLEFTKLEVDGLFPFLKYRLYNCGIARYEPGGSDDEGLWETIGISYDAIEWSYIERNANGAFLSPITRSFSIKWNSADLSDPPQSLNLGASERVIETTAIPSQITLPIQTSTYVRNSAFIVMWMDSDKPELEDVHLTIKSVCESFGISAVRADDIQHDDRITDVILDKIRTSEFIIADLTGERPNVYYEVGHAQAIGKRPMLFRRKGSVLHFDLSVHNVREYKNVTELREILSKRLEALLK
jgi:type VI secretion system Hcp family effector